MWGLNQQAAAVLILASSAAIAFNVDNLDSDGFVDQDASAVVIEAAETDRRGRQGRQFGFGGFWSQFGQAPLGGSSNFRGIGSFPASTMPLFPVGQGSGNFMCQLPSGQKILCGRQFGGGFGGAGGFPQGGGIGFPGAGGIGGFPGAGGIGGFPGGIGGFPGAGGGYPPQGGQGGYPPQGGQGGYPPQGGQGGYPPQGGQGGYPPQGGQGGYPPQGGAPPQGGQGGYPPQGGQGPPPPPPQGRPPRPDPSAPVPATEKPAPPQGPPGPGSAYPDTCGVGKYHPIRYNENGTVAEEQERLDNDNQHPFKVVNGWPADQGEWPWIAALLQNGRQFCGGSLISRKHILTAAHCVAHMSRSDVAALTVRLGEYNIKQSGETQIFETKAKRVVRHKDFTQQTLHKDVAIITLDKEVPVMNNVRAVCLDEGSNRHAGETGTVVGWGSIKEAGPQPDILREVTVKIWDNPTCKDTYGNAAPGGIMDHMLCAGQKGKDSCSGDSGGPMSIGTGATWTQIGIVSWGIGCGKSHYPGVYTRVASVRPWIEKIVNEY